MANSTHPRRVGEPAVLEPAVAGFFYPGGSKTLSREIDALLDQAPSIPLPGLRALICPHAGYRFSGPTAACAYRQLVGIPFRTVLVMGPSHYALFRGAALPSAGTYRTPLGEMPLSAQALCLAGYSPFVLDPECTVQRPEWWRERPGGPPQGRDTPFTWEHSVEVQLPFLQKVLPGAELVPVVFGDLDPREAARVLAGHVDDATLVVASSDLSHFHPDDEARRLDASCVQAICDLDTDRMEGEEACGKGPILTLMHLARIKGWRATLLDARNSGDAGGGRATVVGYAAIAFCQEEVPEEIEEEGKKEGREEGREAPSGQLSHPERTFLLDLARRAVVAAAAHRHPPMADPNHLTQRIQEPGACFVTLRAKGELRGCIGHILAREPLFQSVLDNARAAAVEDTRFPPVGPAEVGGLEIEISVLTHPEPLEFACPQELLDRLSPGEDGLILRRGPLQATFLPQVWEQLPDKQDFLRHLSIKAGGGAELWSQPGVEVQIYRVEAFRER